MLEGNTDRRVMASVDQRPGVEGPFAHHMMSSKQPVRACEFLNPRTTRSLRFEYAPPSGKSEAGK